MIYSIFNYDAKCIMMTSQEYATFSFKSWEIDLAKLINMEFCARETRDYKNMTCLVGKMFADLYISTFVEEGRPAAMKIAEPAIWTEIYSFPV